MSYFATDLQSSDFEILFGSKNAIFGDTDTNLLLPTPSSTLHEGNGAESFNNSNPISPDMQHPFNFVNDNDPIFDTDLGTINFTGTQRPFDFFSDNDTNFMNMQQPFEVTSGDADFDMSSGSSTLTTAKSGSQAPQSFSSLSKFGGSMRLGEGGFAGMSMSSQEDITMLQGMDDECLTPGMQGFLNYLDNRPKHQGTNMGQPSQPASGALHSQIHRNTSSGQQLSLPTSQSRCSSTQHQKPVQGSRVTKKPAPKAAVTVKEACESPKKRSTPKKSSPKTPKTPHVNLLRGAPSSVLAAYNQGNSMVNVSRGSPISTTRIANASRGSPNSLPTTRAQGNSIASASASRGFPIHLPAARVQENSTVGFSNDPQLSPSFEGQMRASLGSYLNGTEQTFQSYMGGEQTLSSYMGQEQTNSTPRRTTTSPVQCPLTNTSIAQAPTPPPAPAFIVDVAAASLVTQSRYLESLIRKFVNSPIMQQQFMNEYGYSEGRVREFTTSRAEQHNVMRHMLQNPEFQRMIAQNISQSIPSYGTQRQRSALARAQQLGGRRR